MHSFSKIAENVFLVELQGYSCNAYLLYDGKTAMAIDPGLEGKEVWRKALSSLGLQFGDVESALLTHSHYDHAYNARLFPNATVAASQNAIQKLEANDPTTFFSLAKLSYADSGKRKILKNGEKIAFGPSGNGIECVETPGHSNCAMCFYERKSRVFFSGDTIFPSGSLPRIFDSTKRELARSYEKIEKLALEWEKEGAGPKTLAPGHGNAGDFWEEFNAARRALETV